MDRSELLFRVHQWLGSLSTRDRTGVLVHGDPDGLASGVVLCEAVRLLTKKDPEVLLSSSYGGHELMEEKLDVFRFARCNKLLVADLSFDQDAFFVSEAEKFCEGVLFIDHHKVYADLNSEKTVFVKASAVSDINSSQYPASKLCFDLVSPVVNLDRVAWVAAVGILGDSAGLQWKSFVEQAAAFSKSSFRELEECKEVIEAVGLIEPFRFTELWKAFWNASSPRAILKSSFADLLSELRSEMAYWLKRFQSEKEVFPDLELVWFSCAPRFPIKAPLVNKLSIEFFPTQTVVMIQENDAKKGLVSVSARRQDGNVAVNDLLEAAVQNIPGALAGGHAPAAGGKVPKAFLEQFKRNVLRELEKKYFNKR